MAVPPLGRQDPGPQTLDEIREWHRGVVDVLVEQLASVQHAIGSNSAVQARFMGMTEAGVVVFHVAQRRELDHLTMLNLVASTEAAIKTDYNRRAKDRLRDRLSVAYRKFREGLNSLKRQRPDFDEGGILEVLKQARVMDNHIVGRFRECLKLRHWVAHGRYWAKPVELVRLDPDEVFTRCDALLHALPQ